MARGNVLKMTEGSGGGPAEGQEGNAGGAGAPNPSNGGEGGPITKSDAGELAPTAAPTSRHYYAQAKIEQAGFEAELARLELQLGDIEDAYQVDLGRLTAQRDAALQAVQRVIDDTRVSLGMALDKRVAFERNAIQGSA